MKDLQAYLENRLLELNDWLDKNEVEAYRWYDHQLETHPFSIDVYLDALHIHVSETDTNNLENTSVLSDFFVKQFDFEASKIFIKSRKPQKGKSQYNKFYSTSKRFIIQENRNLFYINLQDYFDSGIFLDHRESRKWVGENSKRKKVLNLFAYTGAFSVYAARGGASKTVTVDTSTTYLDWAEANFKLNKFAKGEHLFIKADAVTYLAELSKAQKEFFDLIIIDPPTFSNSKSRKNIFEVKRDHVALINHGLSILNAGGKILFSTNFTKFKLRKEDIITNKIQEVTIETTPLDFKNSPFIRYCFILEKK